MMKAVSALMLALGVVACASINDRGWTGEGATPFDAAANACAQQTQSSEGEAYEACMASHGWRRP